MPVPTGSDLSNFEVALSFLQQLNIIRCQKPQKALMRQEI